MTSEITPIDPLEKSALQPIMESSLHEGYRFIQKLWHEYEQGINRFETPGTLIGAFVENPMVGIGGVQVDPYLQQANIGRIRHVYVLPDYRRSGVGRQVMHALIDHARAHFTTLTLRTPTRHGDAFYQSLGFRTEPRFADATHWLDLRMEA